MITAVSHECFDDYATNDSVSPVPKQLLIKMKYEKTKEAIYYWWK